MTTPAAPTPRPARGFTTSRAQRWILTSAILTAVIYAFRRLVEPTTGAASPAKGGALARLAGAGTPPASVEHWAVGYSAAYLMLAILALVAPEAAASLAAITVLGNLLTNGTTIAADITGLEGSTPPPPGPPAAVSSMTVARPASTSTAPAASVSAPGTSNAPNMFQDPFAGFPTVPSPLPRGIK